MRGFAEIIDSWPVPAVRTFAQDLGIREGTASAWKTRGIPAHAWFAVVEAAKVRNIAGVTYEVLARLAARLKPKPTIADAKGMARRYRLQGVVIFHFDDSFGYASWGEDAEICATMRKFADEVTGMVERASAKTMEHSGG
ncbi:MAG: hypothetical protein IH904_05075 [Proteobacteria bacterium]|nr:hypothetical protein [Pseudomonadota bacterium]